MSFGTTPLSWSQHIDAVAQELWPAGCVDPCFNSVTSLAAGFSAGRKGHGPMSCNAARSGFAAPPKQRWDWGAGRHAWEWNQSNAPATDEQRLVGVVCSAICGRCHLDQHRLIKHKHSTRSNGLIGNQIQKTRQRLIQLFVGIHRIVTSADSKAHGIPDCRLLHLSALSPLDSIEGRRQQ